MTIALRAYADADADWLDGWLSDVAASVGYEAAAIGGDVATRVILRDGAPAGMVRYRVRSVTTDAIIELVATPAAEARRGVGMAGAALVEAELHAAGVTRVYAPAPEVHGIAMYFWIRLGYRPLMRGEWPCEHAGVAWLVRELE